MTEKSKYIRFDWAIKRILRDKANAEVLEGLMTVLIGQPMKIVEILESEANVDARDDKYNRVDVKAQTSKGEYVIVEVQLTKQANFFQRILFGTSRAVTEQIGIGEDYDVIKKIYSINILYFDFGSGDDYAYHGQTLFHGMNDKESVLQFNSENEKEYMKKTTAVRVTPPEEVFPEFFLLRVNQFNEVAKTPIEEWMAYLKDGIIRDDTSTPGLQAARKKLAYMSMSATERHAYDEYMVSVFTAKDMLATAIAEGFAEGMEKGMEKGMAEVARRMKSKGMPLETIAEMTGLSIEIITGL